jgi:act minimal PKS chain-length factor (CLF/KS beta)
MSAGAAPADVAAALLTIRDGLIPPTVNVRPSPRYPIELVVGAPRRAPVRAAVVIARGYGGFNSVLVVRAATGGDAGHPRNGSEATQGATGDAGHHV